MLQIRHEVFYGKVWVVRIITEKRSNNMVSIGKNHTINIRLPTNLQREERAKTIRELIGWAKDRLPLTTKEIKNKDFPVF